MIKEKEQDTKLSIISSQLCKENQCRFKRLEGRMPKILIVLELG